ncbi:MAG: helix-turn-helix transcriptional regulator [Clostridia bacterium]|nr:helix-turn-helix transcriptional regulator [Clostridia bacterium]
MEENTVITKQIAKNLTVLRKRAKLTQAEVAEKINYSDKSVSKWESAGGVPDIFILIQLAKLYGVTVNEIVGEKSPVPPKEGKTGLHVLIMLLSAGIVWLVAVCVFALLQVLPVKGAWWLAFIYALPINAIVFVVFACIWKYKMLHFVSVSTLIWTGLLSLYLSIALIPKTLVALESLWPIFLIGVPLQVLAILWAFFRYSVFKRRKAANAQKEREKIVEE